jgi:hypothetical protein
MASQNFTGIERPAGALSGKRERDVTPDAERRARRTQQTVPQKPGEARCNRPEARSGLI